MRTALTLGFDKDGKATIISQPSVSIHEQRAAFKTLAKGSDYAEIQLWESGRGLRRSKRFFNDGNVNFNAAHLVENQQAAKKKGKKLPDLTPKMGKEGGVNFNAAHPVEDQQKKGKKLVDLTPDEKDAGKKKGVNFDASLPVDEQGENKVARPSRLRSKKSSNAKSQKTASSEEKSHSKIAGSTEGGSEEISGPSL